MLSEVLHAAGRLSASILAACRMPWADPAAAAASAPQLATEAEPDVKPAVQLPPSVLKPSVIAAPEPEVRIDTQASVPQLPVLAQ